MLLPGCCCRKRMQLRVECSGVLCAAIALAAPGQLVPVRLSVDSGDRVSSVDAWSPSKHQVTRHSAPPLLTVPSLFTG